MTYRENAAGIARREELQSNSPELHRTTTKSAKNLSAERCFAASAEQKSAMARENAAVICGYYKVFSCSQSTFLPAQALWVRLSSAIAEGSRTRTPDGGAF